MKKIRPPRPANIRSNKMLFVLVPTIPTPATINIEIENTIPVLINKFLLPVASVNLPHPNTIKLIPRRRPKNIIRPEIL